MSGLFSTFNIATRGMSVQQKAIDVTSHNVANANTPGYSRQRALIETTRPFGMPTLNNVAEPGQLGTGAQVSAIQRYRDAFLDYQTRVESSKMGQYSTRQKILSEAEAILNEPTDTGLSSRMGAFFDSWQQLSLQPASSNTRTMVAQQSSTLADNLNHTAKQLTDLKDNVQLEIKSTVFDVNASLKQIEQLNAQIRAVAIAGNKANDLMDKRDLLIDGLSSKFNINVEKKEFDSVDITPVDEKNRYVVNVDDSKSSSRLSYISSIDKDASDATGKTYTITYNKLGDSLNSQSTGKITITNVVDPTKLKDLQQGRVLWADGDGNAVDTSGNVIADNSVIDISNISNIASFNPSDGEIKGFQSVQKDIDDYMDQLNRLAKTLALSVNAVHNGQADSADGGATPDSIPFFVNSEKANYDPNNKDALLNPVAVSTAEADITAANISVNKEILADVMKIKAGTLDTSGEGDGTRAKAIAGIRDTLLMVQDVDGTTTRAGFILSNNLLPGGLGIKGNTDGIKLENYFKDTIDRLGIQSQEASNIVSAQENILANFEESRTSISGVSLDEETANLVQYQHAYQANAKIVSVIDELLDVVINGLKK